MGRESGVSGERGVRAVRAVVGDGGTGRGNVRQESVVEWTIRPSRVAPSPVQDQVSYNHMYSVNRKCKCIALFFYVRQTSMEQN